MRLKMSAFTAEGSLGTASSDQFNNSNVQWKFLSQRFSADLLLMVFWCLPNMQDFCRREKEKLSFLPSPQHLLLSEHSSVVSYINTRASSRKLWPLVILEDRCSALLFIDWFTLHLVQWKNERGHITLVSMLLCNEPSWMAASTHSVIC